MTLPYEYDHDCRDCGGDAGGYHLCRYHAESRKAAK